MIEQNANDTAEVSYPDDFAAFEAQMQGGKPAEPAAEEETEEETPSEDSGGKTPESKTADESETSDDDPEPEKENEEKPSKRGLEKRFRDLTSQVRELKAALAAKAEPGVASPKVDHAKAESGEPQTGDFDTYEDYVRALAKFTVREERAAQTRAEQQKTVVDVWTERESAVRAKHADYDDVVASVDDIVFPQAMGEALMDSEKGPEIAYYLASNREEAERIATLNPVAAIRAIGAIEAKLSTPPPAPKPKPKVSSAPEPITPVSKPSATRATRFDDPGVDFATFEKAANARFSR